MPAPDPSLAIVGGGDTHVAPLLPPTAASPEPTRKINFFKALLLHWLMPKRYGPHLAAGSWTRALGAHVLSVLTMTAAVLLALLITIDAHIARGLYGLREAAAQFIIEAAARSASSPGSTSWLSNLAPLLAIPLGELGLVLLAILIMPWYAGGDRAGSVFKRSLKSVYWSTTLLVPIAPIVFVLILHPVDLDHLVEHNKDLVGAGVGLGAIAVPAVLLLRMLLAGGTRYVGPAEGPAFAPREPHCEDCGYLIVGLPLDARCPECGLQVALSLPGGRRRPTVWQENELKARGFADLLRLQFATVLDRDFFKHLPVQTGLSAARHFWWGTWGLMLLATLIVVKIIALADSRESEQLALVFFSAIGVLVVPLVLQALMMFAGCMYGQLRHGLRDYRMSAVVCYYVSPMMWPVPLLVLLAWLPSGRETRRWIHEVFLAPAPLNQWMDGVAFYETVLALVFLGVLLLWWLRLCRALRDIQHANV